MADSSTLSLRVEDQIIDALDRAAGSANVSRSALARVCLLEGVRQLAEGDLDGEPDIEVPDWLGHEAKTREMIARNKAERRRGKFRSEFSKQLRRSFENNETPSEFKQSVAGYLEEAEDLGPLPEGVQAETPADVRTFAEWCEHMLRYYTAAFQGQNFDHDPIDDPLGNHEGIENMRDWMRRAENIQQAAEKGDRDTALNIARHARQDGVVPERVEQEATEAEDPAKAIITAARSMQAPALEGGESG